MPAGAALTVPPGFHIVRSAEGFTKPRQIIAAPNGDLFVTESAAGRVVALHPSPDGARLARREVFASGLYLPFGMAFYPPGANPGICMWPTRTRLSIPV